MGVAEYQRLFLLHKSDQLQFHYRVFMFTAALFTPTMQNNCTFSQLWLTCSTSIMCSDTIPESYYVTSSDNNGVFLPYYCIQYAVYGPAVYTDLYGYGNRNL